MLLSLRLFSTYRASSCHSQESGRWTDGQGKLQLVKRNGDAPGILCPSFLPLVISVLSSHEGSADGVMKNRCWKNQNWQLGQRPCDELVLTYHHREWKGLRVWDSTVGSVTPYDMPRHWTESMELNTWYSAIKDPVCLLAKLIWLTQWVSELGRKGRTISRGRSIFPLWSHCQHDNVKIFTCPLRSFCGV